jgi:hypothetical protein
LPEASKARSPVFGNPSRALLCRIAIAGLCLLAQLSGLVHLALVRHATCLEHDTLVHAEATTESGGNRTTPTADRLVPGASHADDHCLAAGWRRRDLAAARSAVGLTLSAPAGPALPLDQRRALPPPPVALLRFAPKSSPPFVCVG